MKFKIGDVLVIPRSSKLFCVVIAVGPDICQDCAEGARRGYRILEFNRDWPEGGGIFYTLNDWYTHKNFILAQEISRIEN